MRLLVIDDLETIRFALHGFFTRRGCTVDCAGEPDGARSLLNRNTYDVMVTDLRLIDGNEGFDLAQEVRSRFPSTLVIVLTAYGSPAVEAEVSAIGARLLAKPQPLSLLFETIERMRAGT